MSTPEHGHGLDGAALAEMQAKLAPLGEWGDYLKAQGIAYMTAQDLIKRFQGTYRSYRASTDTNTVAPRLLEPEQEAASPERGLTTLPSPDERAADTAMSKPKMAKKQARPKPTQDAWEEEPDETVMVPLPVEDVQLYRRMRRYFTVLAAEGHEHFGLDTGAAGDLLDRLFDYMDASAGDERLFACERLSRDDLWQLRQAAMGRDALPQGLSAAERAALPAPTPGQMLAIRTAYEALDGYEASLVERAVLRDHRTRQQAEQLVELFEDSTTSAEALRLALAPIDLVRQALPLVQLLTHLRLCAQVSEQAVTAWLEMATPEEQQQAGETLAEVAELQRHLWEGIHEHSRAAAEAEAQRAQESATQTAAMSFDEAVKRERVEGVASYLPSRFSIEAKPKVRW
jgi:hypothetical protein